MVMSIISGVFFLDNGVRIAGPPPSSQKSTSPPIYRNYISYDTHVLTSNPAFSDYPATIQYYSPERPFKGDTKEYLGILPNGTAVVAIAKLAVAPSKMPGVSGVLMEAIDMFPIPGNPDDATSDDENPGMAVDENGGDVVNENDGNNGGNDDDDYNARVPAFQFPFLSGAGHVSGAARKVDGDKGGRVVPVVVEQFVNRTLYKFDVECFYDSSRRWADVPVPDIGSCIAFTGECESYQRTGVLRIALKNIVLKCQSQNVQPATASPSKKRKFTAVLPVPPRANPLSETPVAGPSNSSVAQPAQPVLNASTKPAKKDSKKKKTVSVPQVPARSSTRGKQPVFESVEEPAGDAGVGALQELGAQAM